MLGLLILADLACLHIACSSIRLTFLVHFHATLSESQVIVITTPFPPLHSIAALLLLAELQLPIS
jgi:hypothetical protein